MESVRSSLLPSLARRGVFGPGELVSVGVDSESELALQFASRVAMFQVELRDPTTTVHVVAKLQLVDDEARMARDTAAMFYNEMVMYEAVLPFLDAGRSCSYPKMYYGRANLGSDWEGDVILLENLKPRGFTLSVEKTFLDYNHIVLAMKKIGELHSWSYTAKQRDPQRFQEAKDKLKKLTTVPDKFFDFQKANFFAMKRGVEPFMEEEKEVLKRFLEIIRPVFATTEFLFAPVEPFAAVIHGDFCKNNLFYKYDNEGKPTDCAYFDLQLAKYSSPAIDISFFLYMHTTSEMRERHWDEFLEIYWTSVKEHVPRDIALPSYNEFLDHFSKYAVYGYFPCSFFLPMMMEEDEIDFEEFVKLTEEEKIEHFLKAGGENGKQGVIEIVSHLLKNNYIHSFVKHYNLTSV